MEIVARSGDAVLDDRRLEIPLGGTAYGRFNAYVGRNAANDQGGDPTALEEQVEVRIQKGVVSRLGDHHVVLRRLQLG